MFKKFVRSCEMTGYVSPILYFAKMYATSMYYWNTAIVLRWFPWNASTQVDVIILVSINQHVLILECFLQATWISYFACQCWRNLQWAWRCGRGYFRTIVIYLNFTLLCQNQVAAALIEEILWKFPNVHRRWYLKRHR